MTHYHSIDSKMTSFFCNHCFFFFLSVIVSSKFANLELSEYITFWVSEFNSANLRLSENQNCANSNKSKVSDFATSARLIFIFARLNPIKQ